MKKDKLQLGFGAVEIIIIVAVVLVAGLIGYNVWSSSNKDDMPAATGTTGGPAPGHTVSKTIKLVTGQYMPANIDVKKGTTVTWQITDAGDIPQYGVESNTDSAEKFSSDLLKTGDTFSHKFNTVGTFGWHDKYNGYLTGTVTVTE